jgi:type IV secretory pathway VirB10-like protein
MLLQFSTRFAVFAFLISLPAVAGLLAQEPPAPSSQGAAPVTQENSNSTTPAPDNSRIAVPTGTRLPLLLRNGINTRTAKAGDSVYFETVYPIAVNNRIVIPMGTFVRGEILEAKRPGRIHGRGQLRMVLEQMTYPNGYTIELRASPSSVDPTQVRASTRKKPSKAPPAPCAIPPRCS